MNIEELREHCLSIKGAIECLPFDEYTLVFKVMDKMFACISLEPHDGEFSVALKCDPEKAEELRKEYEGIQPAYHFNKKHWNSVYLVSDASDEMIKGLIAHSVDVVIAKLSKKLQEEYRNS